MDLIRSAYTAAECRKLDQLAIREAKIPSFGLMQRAGQFAFDTMVHEWPKARSLQVIAGTGNNAGDGFIVAGLARAAGLTVGVTTLGELAKMPSDARAAWTWMIDQGVQPELTVRTPDVVVDALLGTGAHGDVRPHYQAAIDYINQSPAHVLALDIPSGIDATTGIRLTTSPVQADCTATFVGVKLGILTGPGIGYRGHLTYSRLGVSPLVYQQVAGVPVLDHTELVQLPQLAPTAHKYDKGHVVLIGGDTGMGGAIILAAEAALRSGAGLVSVVTQPDHLGALLARVPECMASTYSDLESFRQLLRRATVVAIGPGLGRRQWGLDLFQATLAESPKSLIIDADGLYFVGRQDERNLPNTILTPHPGEAAQLLELSSEQVEQDRPKRVCEISAKYSCTTILKGAGTLVGHKGELAAVLNCANTSLATAGSGDVLTGILAAIFGRLQEPLQTALAGVKVHAFAGHKARQLEPERPVIATHLIENIRVQDESK